MLFFLEKRQCVLNFGTENAESVPKFRTRGIGSLNDLDFLADGDADGLISCLFGIKAVYLH